MRAHSIAPLNPEWTTRRCGGETLGDSVPVNDIVPGVDIVRTPILVVQVVGVLPDINTEIGVLPCEIGLSWLAVDSTTRPPLPSTESQAQPLPKRVRAAFLRLPLKSSRLPNVLSIALAKSPLARAAALHDRQNMEWFKLAAAIVAHRAPNRLGHRIQTPDKISTDLPASSELSPIAALRFFT